MDEVNVNLTIDSSPVAITVNDDVQQVITVSLTEAVGINGNTILNGNSSPSNSLGVNGDFYLDTSSYVLYGPKTSGAWGSGTSLISGSTIYSRITDGTTIASASTSNDIVKFRSSNNLITVTVGSNDVTHGDNVLFTFNSNNLSLSSSQITDGTSVFAGISHSHIVSDVTGLQTILDSKAGTSHTHAISDVTGLQAAIDNKLDDSQASVFGLSILDDADAAAARITLGLGTAATSSSSSFAASSHSHVISDTSGLQSALDDKASVSHTHIIGDVTGLQTILDNKVGNSQISVFGLSLIDDADSTAARVTLGLGTAATFSSSSFASASHSHVIADITNLQTSLDGKASSSHTHIISDVTGLQTALDNKIDDSQISAFGITLIDDADASSARTTLGLGTAATAASSSFASSSHTHIISDVTGLQTALDNKVDDSQISVFGLSLIDDANATTARLTLGLGSAATSDTSSFAPISHTHVAADITDGTSVFAESIHSHIISDVTGLQTAIDGKLDNSITKSELNSAISDGDVLFVGDVTGNVTHTGEVTGSTSLAIDKTAITNKTEVTPADDDYILISDDSDSGNLKKVKISDLSTGGSQEFYVQPSQPSTLGPAFWMQTGLGEDGTGFTLWAIY